MCPNKARAQQGRRIDSNACPKSLPPYPSSPACAYRKSYPAILMVQSAHDRAANDMPGPLDAERDRSILLNDKLAACRCNSPCTTAARGADGVRQISQYDQCIPCRSSR